MLHSYTSPRTLLCPCEGRCATTPTRCMCRRAMCGILREHQPFSLAFFIVFIIILLTPAFFCSTLCHHTSYTCYFWFYAWASPSASPRLALASSQQAYQTHTHSQFQHLLRPHRSLHSQSTTRRYMLHLLTRSALLFPVSPPPAQRPHRRSRCVLLAFRGIFATESSSAFSQSAPRSRQISVLRLHFKRRSRWTIASETSTKA